MLYALLQSFFCHLIHNVQLRMDVDDVQSPRYDSNSLVPTIHCAVEQFTSKEFLSRITFVINDCCILSEGSNQVSVGEDWSWPSGY